MSAAVKKNNIQPFHIARGIYSDELDATKKFLNFLIKNWILFINIMEDIQL